MNLLHGGSRMRRFAGACLAFSCFLFVPGVFSQVPQLINYQGRVAVSGVNFNGTGNFKFALVNGNGAQTFWSNDGTSNAGSEPAAAVALLVGNGLYAVLLGDSAIANMQPVPASVFDNHPDVRLRVWFDDGVNGSQLLAPDQRVGAVGYAMMAGSVPDGAITGAKIANGAVTALQLAPGAAASNLGAGGQSGVSSGGVILSADPNSASLVAAGYVRIGETQATDFWKQRSSNNAASFRREHTAVWTGSEMIIWGGRDLLGALRSGARYAPAFDSWTPMTNANAPEARYRQSAVWTGALMIVWGGNNGALGLNTGGLYNPVADTWVATNSATAPVARYAHVAVWSGSKMVVYSGIGGGTTGSRYDPAGDSWAPTTLVNAPVTGADPKAVWTGSEMLVWGGQNQATGVYPTAGGRYDPVSDVWTAMSTTGVPAGRSRHTAIWTGSEMIVWGGVTQASGSGGTNTGGRYTPGANWVAMPSTDAPSARSEHTAVWTGTEMIIWGGTSSTTGGRFNPALANAWIATTTTNVPSERMVHTAIWANVEMIVFGGVSVSTGNFALNIPFSYIPPRTLFLYQKP